MMKMRNTVNLDKTFQATVSSFAYKDPYQPSYNILKATRNSIWTFFATRNIENEFVDFRSYMITEQFTGIYSQVQAAFKSKDKVVLQRSLSQSMYPYCIELHKAN
jgi:hypothetical protein